MSEPKFRREIQMVRLVTVVAAILAVGIFAALTVIAVQAFSSNQTFGWSSNFLSDLGRSSQASATYFNTGLILLGCVLLPFFAFLPRNCDQDSISMLIASSAGFVSALALIDLGATPLDEGVAQHNLAFGTWYLAASIAVVTFNGVPHRNLIERILSLLLTVIWLSVSIFYLSSETDLRMLLQKFLICGSVLWFFLVAFHSIRASFVVRTVHRRASLDQLADQYIEKSIRF